MDIKPPASQDSMALAPPDDSPKDSSDDSPKDKPKVVTKANPKSSLKSPAKSKDVTLAIEATVVIVLCLAAIATVAYLHQAK